MRTPVDKYKQILNANQILSSTLNLDELLRQVIKLATDVVEAETSSILLYDKDKDELVFNLALTEKESELKEVRLKLSEGIAGLVARERKPRIVNDIKEEPRWTQRTDDKIDFKTKSLLAVPLVYKGNLLGVVESVNKKEGKFTDEDVDVLEAFAAQAAVSIENARLFNNLEEEKDKIEAVFSQMSDGAIFFNSKGAKLFSNNQAERLLGSEYIEKSNVTEVFKEFKVEPSIEAILKSDKDFISVEFHRSENKTLYLSGGVSKILDENKNIQGFIIVFRDTTAEKKEELVKRNFLSLISHKLKTPLVTITGYGPLLLGDPKLDDFQKKAVSSIQKQGQHLANLVEKLLDYTMVESGPIVLKKEDADLFEIVKKSVSSLKPYIEQNSAEVFISEDVKSLPKIKIDKIKIESVIKNLLENGIKFNSGKDKKVEVKALQKNGFIGISMEDNGPGIPPEEREKIFNKFYQIEEFFTGQVEGAGLGLALTKQILEAHGGKIELESSMGKGSKFRFLLPEK
ncbi:MAG: GAF domain-containing protein [Endomicrobiales bacterium]|nr:GAF domain-containing protein [Endomicrobiales bacterium]